MKQFAALFSLLQLPAHKTDNVVAEYCTCAELLRNNLLIVYEDILIPRNRGDGWRMRVQVLPLVVRRRGFEANATVAA